MSDVCVVFVSVGCFSPVPNSEQTNRGEGDRMRVWERRETLRVEKRRGGEQRNKGDFSRCGAMAEAMGMG